MQRQTFISLYFLGIFLQAGAYGLTFLLPALFARFGGNEADVGFVLALTAIATLIVVIYSGHITAVTGLMTTIAIAGGLITLAGLLFGLARETGLIVQSAGLLLGAGWGLFYTLTPVALNRVIHPHERIQYFTLLSVFIMAGFGLTPVFGAVLTRLGFDIGLTFLATAGLCGASTILFFWLTRPMRALTIEKQIVDKTRLTITAIKDVMTSRAAIPIAMVGIGASVFAGVTNFQIVYADAQNLAYADYFLAYTVTVIVCRVIFAQFMGGRSPYAVIALLLGVMGLSVMLFIIQQSSVFLYVLGAILFGIGYGVSYPIIKAMAANEANPEILPQTLQLFGLSYFIGVFGFPFVAGHMIVQGGMAILLWTAFGLAILECALASGRFFKRL
ncbi:MFS transporter [uncultured Candidatus Puniceispirillum sp.]|uniref:MFS transporter n=1 Tax=uncultured Candidatus Puniceispirillum sp. TaxID=1985115 RepID=UPI0032B17A7D